MLGVLRRDASDPAELAPAPGVAALDSLVDRVRAAGFVVSLESKSTKTGTLSPSVQLSIYRIVQEALTNVVKHAGARAVTVELTRNDEQLHLSVRDDGVGFDVARLREQAVHGASLGLLSMEERATLAGGGLQYHSTPGQGTEVHAWFPIKWAHPAVLIGAI